MNAQETRYEINFDESVAPESFQVARWTANHRVMQAVVRVLKVNKACFRVEIVALAPNGYRIGQALSIPRLYAIYAGQWTANNRLYPLPEKLALVTGVKPEIDVLVDACIHCNQTTSITGRHDEAELTDRHTRNTLQFFWNQYRFLPTSPKGLPAMIDLTPSPPRASDRTEAEAMGMATDEFGGSECP